MRLRRKILLISVFFAVIGRASAPAPRIDYDSVNNFNRPWQDFMRRYAGCEEVALPKDGPSTFVRKCYPIAGFTDLDSFRRAREAAKTLFGLR